MMIDRRMIVGLGLSAPLWSAAPLVASAQETTPAASPLAFDAPEDGPNTELKTETAESNHMLAPVMVNGQGPFQFVVDTGANRSAISTALAARLNLPPGPNVRLHTVAGARTRPTAIINELRVGARVQRRVRAPTLSISGMAADGILGVDWLKSSRLAFDFRAKRLEITSSRFEVEGAQSYGDRSAVMVPARMRSGQITIIDADMSGRKMAAMIDSGSELSLGNGALRELVRRNQPSGKTEPLEIITITGEHLPGELLYVPFLRLGGLQLGNVPVVFAKVHVFSLWDMERDPALILGMDLLRQFDAVTMDYGRARVRFDLA